MALFVAPKSDVTASAAAACSLGVWLSDAPVWRSVMAWGWRSGDGSGGAMVEMDEGRAEIGDEKNYASDVRPRGGHKRWIRTII